MYSSPSSSRGAAASSRRARPMTRKAHSVRQTSKSESGDWPQSVSRSRVPSMAPSSPSCSGARGRPRSRASASAWTTQRDSRSPHPFSTRCQASMREMPSRISCGVLMFKVIDSLGAAPSSRWYSPLSHSNACRMMSRVWSTTPFTSSLGSRNPLSTRIVPNRFPGARARTASSIWRRVMASRLSRRGPRRWSVLEDEAKTRRPFSTVTPIRKPDRSRRRTPVQLRWLSSWKTSVMSRSASLPSLIGVASAVSPPPPGARPPAAGSAARGGR